MDICFAIALTSTVVLRIAGPLTLAWDHSVEHFRIEEDYRATSGGALLLGEVRTQGLGAGVDIPADAHKFEGGWRFTPRLPPLPEVRLANSRFGPGYTVCSAGRCAPLADLVQRKYEPLVMRACAAAQSADRAFAPTPPPAQ